MRERIQGMLLGVLVAVALAVGAQSTFNYFSPGPPGPVKSNGTATLQAEVASDIVGLWSTCSASDPALGYLGTCIAVGAGTVTSVSFADDSTSALYSVGGSPCSTTCALTITLVTQNANCVVAGPASGSAAEPTCRSLVTADFPASGVTAGSYTNADITVNAEGIVTAASNGSSSGCTFANPTGTVGLSVVDGSASTCMRSDAAPPLSQAITPTWTGVHTFSAAPVFSAGTTYANNEPLSGTTSGATVYTAFIPLDGSNNLDIENVAAEPINLQVAPSAGSTPVTGIKVIAENSTYAQGQTADAGGTAQNIGYLQCVFNPQTSNYTLVLSDRDKCIATNDAITVTIPDNVFSAGDVVCFLEYSSGGNVLTIAQGVGFGLNWANGGTSAGNRTLAGYGEACVLFGGATFGFISSGGGLT